MATHFSIFAGKISWTEEPGRHIVLGTAKSRTWLSNWAHGELLFTKDKRKKWKHSLKKNLYDDLRLEDLFLMIFKNRHCTYLGLVSKKPNLQNHEKEVRRTVKWVFLLCEIVVIYLVVNICLTIFPGWLLIWNQMTYEKHLCKLKVL